MTHSYVLHGMHCEGCVAKIAKALQGVPGVTSAKVTLSPPRAQVEMNEHIEMSRLAAAVSASGDYRLEEVSHEPTTANVGTAAEGKKESLYPLFLIVAYIAGTVGLITVVGGDRSVHTVMRHFMAGFFLVFSFFKLLDLRGFADPYQSYDIVAQRFSGWAFAYPFVELALGVAYLLNLYPVPVNAATLTILPMTKVTLAEDLGMAAMAAAMLATL